MKQEILKKLEKESYISGEKIAKDLKITRTAVWKQIKNLQKDGYEIKAVKNKGYKLLKKPDIPYEEEIKTEKNKIMGKKILHFKKIDSTNNYAKKIINKNPLEGTIIIADVQTKGRGRKNRQWISSKGGLWFSIILYPDITPDKAMILTMASSISMFETIKEKTGICSRLKWPNDVLINNKKICGILTELDAEIDKVNYMIIGIGVNVNNDIDLDYIDKATSIKIENENEISRVDFLNIFLKKFDVNYQLIKEKDYKYLIKKWLDYSKIIGQKVIVKQGDIVFIGKIVDIDETGVILVNTKKEIKRVISADISYLD